MKEICIYGFGTFGIQTYYALTEKGAKVKCFADRDSHKQGYALEGIHCISYNNLLTLDKKNTILIVAMSNPHKLVQKFRKIGFNYVYDQTNFSDYLVFDNITAAKPVEPIHSVEYLEELKESLSSVLYQNIEKEIANRELQQIVNDYVKRNTGLTL